jgi:hypothetical protein
MPVSPKKRRNNDAYNAKCDRITLQPLQPVGADIRTAAAQAGESLQRYALQAVRDRMARDGFEPAADWPCSPSREVAPHE